MKQWHWRHWHLELEWGHNGGLGVVISGLFFSAWCGRFGVMFCRDTWDDL